MLHTICVFSNPVLGTQAWTSTLWLWKVSPLSFRFTILLLWDSCYFSLQLIAPIFVPSSHPSPTWRAFLPRGRATHNTCSASRYAVLPASCPLLPPLAPSLSLGIGSLPILESWHIPRWQILHPEKPFSHLQLLPHPSSSLRSLELHWKESSI